MSGIDRFSKEEFESALSSESWYKWTCKGFEHGQYVYLLTTKSPHVAIVVFSSIDESGIARDNAKDSIRAVMAHVESDGRVTLLPGKVQTYVTRRVNWRVNLQKMLRQLALLARWIQPCPTCDQLLRLAVRRKDKEVYLFCGADAKERNNPAHERHMPLTVIDFNTGEVLRESNPPVETDAPACPTCGIPLRKVDIRNGSNRGKQAWSCPAKAGGKFLNHVFQVID